MFLQFDENQENIVKSVSFLTLKWSELETPLNLVASLKELKFVYVKFEFS